jgi:hypothetical protein
VVTRLYFHVDGSAEAGTLPTTEQSQKTSTVDYESQATNRTMDTTIGTAQTSLTLVRSTSDNTNHVFYVTKFISPELNQTSIAANTWTLNFAVKATNITATGCEDYPSNNVNDRIPICCYVWRPGTGTKVGDIKDGTGPTAGDSANVYYDVGHGTLDVATPDETSEHGTFAGSAVAGVQTGDVIVLEAWVCINTGGTTSVTYSFFYDGGTVTAVNGTHPVSNHASFLETPENLVFVTPAATTGRSFHSYTDTGFWPATSSITF